MAAMAAQSITPIEMFTEQQNALASKSPEHQKRVREYLEGMNTPLSGMISKSVVGDGNQAANLFGALSRLMGGKPLYAAMPGMTVALTGRPRATPASSPVGEPMIAWAEGELGFTLPPDLESFYVEVANGEVGPGAGIYSISGLISKWREMTGEPAGPQGQAWPQELLPILGDHDLFSIDRDSGRIIYWDVNELEIEDEILADDATWEKSFKTVAESLEDWLQSWLKNGIA
jgi:hypothetical protein